MIRSRINASTAASSTGGGAWYEMATSDPRGATHKWCRTFVGFMERKRGRGAGYSAGDLGRYYAPPLVFPLVLLLLQRPQGQTPQTPHGHSPCSKPDPAAGNHTSSIAARCSRLRSSIRPSKCSDDSFKNLARAAT